MMTTIMYNGTRDSAAGSGEPALPPIAALIGFTSSAVSPGEAVIELPAGPQHTNPMGTHVFVALSEALAAFGLMNAGAVAGGAWFGPVAWRRPRVLLRDAYQ
jgi:acyl-coenzyme A thioesterase PaaI-like protein